MSEHSAPSRPPTLRRRARRHRELAGVAALALGASAVVATLAASSAAAAIPATGRAPGDGFVPQPSQVEDVAQLAALSPIDMARTDGGMLVTGNFSGTITLPGGVVLQSAGGLDAYVARINDAGATTWARRVGSVEDDRGAAAVVGTPDGGLAAAFSVKPGATVGQSSGVSIGARALSTPIVLRWDAAGRLVQRLVPTLQGGFGYAEALTVSDDGALLAGGTYVGGFAVGDRRIPTAIFPRGWLARLTADNTLEWLRSPTDGMIAIVALDDGGAATLNQDHLLQWRRNGDGAPLAFRSLGATSCACLATDDGVNVVAITSTADSPLATAVTSFSSPDVMERTITIGDKLAVQDLAATDGVVRLSGVRRQSTTDILFDADTYLGTNAFGIEIDATGTISTVEPLRIEDAASVAFGPSVITRVSVPGMPRSILLGVSNASRIRGVDPLDAPTTTSGASILRTTFGPPGALGATPEPTETVTVDRTAATSPGGVYTDVSIDGMTVVAAAGGGDIRIADHAGGGTLTVDSKDTLVARLAPDGHILQRFVVETIAPTSIAAGRGDGLLLAGWTNGATFPSVSGGVLTGAGYRLVRLDADGDILWALKDVSRVVRHGDVAWAYDGRQLKRIEGDTVTDVSTTFSIWDPTLFGVFPDGDLLLRNSTSLRRINPDGSTVWGLDGARTESAVFLPDGGIVVSGACTALGAARLNGVALQPTVTASMGAPTRWCALRLPATADAPSASPLPHNQWITSGPEGRFLTAARTNEGMPVIEGHDAPTGELAWATRHDGTLIGGEQDAYGATVVTQAGPITRIDRYPAAPPPPATMSVLVTTDAGPLAGAEVTAVDTWLAPETLATGLTGADGRATLQVPPGVVAVRVVDPSKAYATAWAPDDATMARGDRYLATPGGSLDVTTTLTPSAAGGIRGTVRTDEGAPATGMMVTVWDADGALRNAITNTAGAFAVGGLAEGEYRLQFYDGTGRYKGGWYGGATGATATRLAVGAEPVVVDATVARRHTELSVEILAAPHDLAAGDHTYFDVQVRNDGPDWALGTAMELSLPPSVRAHAVAGATSNDGRTWVVGGMAPGTSKTITLDLVADDDLPIGVDEVALHYRSGAIDTDDDDNHESSPIDLVDHSAPGETWATALSGTGTALAYGVATAPDGGLYVTGLYKGQVTFGTGPGAVTWNNTGTAPNLFFLRLDAKGRTIWAQRATSTFRTMDPTGGDVVVGADGKLYVTGFFEGTTTWTGASGDVSLNSLGRTDAFLAKYSTSGVIEWVQRLGGAGSDYAWAADVTPEGDVITSGGYGSGFTAYSADQSIPAPPGYGGFLARYRPDGTLVGASYITSTKSLSDTMVRDVEVRADGSVLAAGSFLGASTFGQGASAPSLASQGMQDGFVVAFSPLEDSSATVLWLSLAGGVGDDRWTGVRTHPDGTITAVGVFADGAMLGGAPAPGAGAIAAGLTAGGDRRWAWRIPDGIRKVELGPDGGAIIYGAVSGAGPLQTVAGATTVRSSGFADGIAIAIDDAGRATGWRTLGGAGNDLAWGLAVGPAGELYLSTSITDVADVCRGADGIRLPAPPATNGVIAKCRAIG